MKKLIRSKHGLAPVVVISFQDHSANLEGESAPYQFLAVGIVYKETREGYYLAHWVDVTDKPKGEVTTYIAKVRGLCIRTISHVKVA